ncbi:MAG: DUF4242 domain-containing protein [Hyphomicrobiales bacterium]|nr:DUF4242 domain-containing protein [Hyphomicrobiales bacterium]MCP5373444.1 DUF4242 domain-containing protein [Hyphomicrobiales bacterium]
MEKMRIFVDTHDTAKGTFPAGLTEEQLQAFLAEFDAACRAENVVMHQANVGLADGRAFCITLAPDAEAVRRAHERVGLPFDSITEVQSISPSALFLKPAAA